MQMSHVELHREDERFEAIRWRLEDRQAGDAPDPDAPDAPDGVLESGIETGG